MAQWTDTINLTEPAGLAPIVSGLADLAAAAGVTLDAGGAALDAAKLFLAGTAAPQAAAATALVGNVEALISDLFGAGFAQLVVHPWTPGVGRLEGVWRHLSFPQAIKAVSDSMDDLADTGRPRYSALAPVEMIVLAAGGPSPSIFKTVLEALNALIGAKEFKLAIRRIDQAFALEAERFNAPKGSKPPDWDAITTRDAFPALAPLEAGLRENLALLKGYAKGGEKAVDIAGTLIDAKKAQLTVLSTKLADAAALFGQGLAGAGAYALHVEGTGGNAFLQSELTAATAAPGPEMSFTAAVAWVAPQGGLTVLKDLLGI